MRLKHSPRRWAIYTLEDPHLPGMVRYVGVTHKSPKSRLRDHVLRAEKNGKKYHSTAWIRSLLNRGVAPAMFVIYGGVGGAWGSVESWWIAWHRERGFDLTNHTDGGEGSLGYNPSLETRQRMSLAKKGKKRSEAAVAKTKLTMSTPEYRARHSASHKGKGASAETLAKMSALVRGRKQTSEHVAARAAANRGKKRSPEVRARFSLVNQGRKHSPETIQKRAASNRGQKRSPEFKVRMSILAQEREAKRRALRDVLNCMGDRVTLGGSKAASVGNVNVGGFDVGAW